ncbi:MAG: metallophosphoesterase [Polyangiaceae bacterium]|nr:metallophosphoesterase [Polyangiaceae bacterium]
MARLGFHPRLGDKRGGISRRNALAGLACCGLGAAGIHAVAIEPRWLDVSEHDIPVPNLPASLEGFRVAQLSDMHLSSVGGLEEKLLAALRERDVGLVAITGDAIESQAAMVVLGGFVREIAKTTKAEIVATLGNWEHWGGVPFDTLSSTYREVGATLLGNEGKSTTSGIVVVATDDYCVGLADLAESLRTSPSGGAARILLTHAPGHLDRPPAGAPPFHLCLAGHTHGGQVRPGFTLWTPPGSGRFVAGAYETPAGRAYVSRGIGTSVLAARLGSRPELPIFRLVRA